MVNARFPVEPQNAEKFTGTGSARASMLSWHRLIHTNTGVAWCRRPMSEVGFLASKRFSSTIWKSRSSLSSKHNTFICVTSLEVESEILNRGANRSETGGGDLRELQPAGRGHVPPLPPADPEGLRKQTASRSNPRLLFSFSIAAAARARKNSLKHEQP